MYLNILLLLDWKNTVNVSDIAVYGTFTGDIMNLKVEYIIYSYKSLEFKVSNILSLFYS